MPTLPKSTRHVTLCQPWHHPREGGPNTPVAWSKLRTRAPLLNQEELEHHSWKCTNDSDRKVRCYITRWPRWNWKKHFANHDHELFANLLLVWSAIISWNQNHNHWFRFMITGVGSETKHMLVLYAMKITIHNQLKYIITVMMMCCKKYNII